MKHTDEEVYHAIRTEHEYQLRTNQHTTHTVDGWKIILEVLLAKVKLAWYEDSPDLYHKLRKFVATCYSACAPEEVQIVTRYDKPLEGYLVSMDYWLDNCNYRLLAEMGFSAMQQHGAVCRENSANPA